MVLSFSVLLSLSFEPFFPSIFLQHFNCWSFPRICLCCSFSSQSHDFEGTWRAPSITTPSSLCLRLYLDISQLFHSINSISAVFKCVWSFTLLTATSSGANFTIVFQLFFNTVCVTKCWQYNLSKNQTQKSSAQKSCMGSLGSQDWLSCCTPAFSALMPATPPSLRGCNPAFALVPTYNTLLLLPFVHTALSPWCAPLLRLPIDVSLSSKAKTNYNLSGNLRQYPEF